MPTTIAIFSAYIEPHVGGIEAYVKNLARELVKNGMKVIIVTSNYADGANYEKVNIFGENNAPNGMSNDVEVYRLPVHKEFRNRYPFIRHNSEYSKLLKQLFQTKIDRIIVNTRFHQTSLIGANLGKKINVPVYLVEHGSQKLTLGNTILDFGLNIIEHILTRLIKPKVTKFYGVSNSANEHLKRRFHIEAAGVWYNSIDASDFMNFGGQPPVFEQFDEKLQKNSNFGGQPPILDSSKYNITYIGRILQQKGVDLLCEAFVKVHQKHPETVLNIVGDGNLLETLQKKYSDNDAIIFFGRKTKLEVLQILSSTTTTTTTTTYPEGLPTVILEAGLYGCTCIATKVSGIIDVLNDENGVLIEPGSVDAIETALNYVIENPAKAKQVAEKLHTDVLENFTWEKTAQKIIKDMEIN